MLIRSATRLIATRGSEFASQWSDLLATVFTPHRTPGVYTGQLDMHSLPLVNDTLTSKGFKLNTNMAKTLGAGQWYSKNDQHVFIGRPNGGKFSIGLYTK